MRGALGISRQHHCVLTTARQNSFVASTCALLPVKPETLACRARTGSASLIYRPVNHLNFQHPRRTKITRHRTLTVQPLAMVNVDVSPAVILGVGLIGAGISLWQIRRVKPWLSRDFDVVVSSISLLVGGILIFQGWRLDPLLLMGQLCTTAAAVSFGVEALRLRSEVYEQEEKSALQDVFRSKKGLNNSRGSGFNDGGGGGDGGDGSYQLPPPPPPPYQGEQGWAGARGRWGGEQATASSSSSQQQQQYYDDQINDQQEQQQQQQQPAGMFGGGDYFEADYYDTQQQQQQDPYYPDDDVYGDSRYTNNNKSPSEFDFPPQEDFSGEGGGGRSGGGSQQPYGTGEDWE